MVITVAHVKLNECNVLSVLVNTAASAAKYTNA